ncbi:uncharacterized protein LOC9644452 [Selaginella moellendorffii]|uniref:uncharacterized protein LOC9644452 n=1 Tax=Selaginella moellendorffii TaxID=88036 RepID=UPI000D1C7D0B|nr:uncharacterized protein LOC9644452 [Selaginella moellendorffii]|eukprot:XP_024521366.1 uncharacterized protein LOC9644452 [Selaginella moellendorffii]
MNELFPHLRPPDNVFDTKNTKAGTGVEQNALIPSQIVLLRDYNLKLLVQGNFCSQVKDAATPDERVFIPMEDFVQVRIVNELQESVGNSVDAGANSVGRAEEKRPGISAAIPLQELRDKTEWRYGGVPYLLAYSAIGGSVTFVALHSRDPSTREVLTKQLVTLDLFQLRDRIRLLVVLFNIARLFPVLSRLCIEYDVEADYLPATTSGDKTVQLQAKNVVKTYKDYDTYCTVFNIYEAIKDVPRVEICTTQRIIQARKRNRSLDYSLTFVPRVTFRQRARPLNNLLPALVQVAKTLNELHNRGWVHRDVHWRNIGKFGGDWYLIDFDEAAMVPCMEPHLLCEDAHAPEMRTGEHGYPVDVWSIGHLIATSKVRCDGGLLQLQDECLSEDPSSRPTMRQVLYRLQELPALLALMGKVLVKLIRASERFVCAASLYLRDNAHKLACDSVEVALVCFDAD